MIKVNLDADLLKVLRRISVKIYGIRYSSNPNDPVLILIDNSAMQGMKL